MIRVGLVDFDTSHVVAFTQRMNHVGVDQKEWVEGARVVAGCPGDSKIMPERIPGYAEQLKSYGIDLVERAEDLPGRIDAVMIESQQGARHLERARPFLERGIPTFVDKPFAGSLKEADAMISLARKHGAPLMSCSALRYDPIVQKALAERDSLGPILNAEVWGSASLHPGNPGLLHYGIHGVEMLYTLMGAGCRSVQNLRTDQGEVAMGLWPGGRIGVARGVRDGQGGFGLTAHFQKGNRTGIVEGSGFYREMLKAVIRMFETRAPSIPLEETREIMAFMEAVERSTRSEGRRAELARPA